MPRQQLLIVLLHIATLLYFAVADNPGVCFQDDGLYRSTSAGKQVDFQIATSTIIPTGMILNSQIHLHPVSREVIAS